MEFKYTEYCTCFCTQNKNGKEIWVWDEVKDRRIQKIRVEDGEIEASKIMREWQYKAPKNCICELI